jgi:hypothetical protein
MTLYEEFEVKVIIQTSGYATWSPAFARRDRQHRKIGNLDK